MLYSFNDKIYYNKASIERLQNGENEFKSMRDKPIQGLDTSKGYAKWKMGGAEYGLGAGQDHQVYTASSHLRIKLRVRTTPTTS